MNKSTVQAVAVVGVLAFTKNALAAFGVAELEGVATDMTDMLINAGSVLVMAAGILYAVYSGTVGRAGMVGVAGGLAGAAAGGTAMAML